MLKVVQEESEANAHVPAGVGGSLLDELVRDGARAMLAAALQAEVAAYVEAHTDQVDEQGHRLVVRKQRSPLRAGGEHRGGCGAGAGAAGQRQTHRRGDW